MKLFLFSLFSFCCLFGEAPVAVYLTWVDDPLTTIEVMWLTKDVGNDRLVLGEVTVEGRHQSLQGLTETLHQVSLKGLKAGEKYSFEVEGEKYKFQMPRGELPCKFIVGGDCYHDEESVFFDMLKAMGEASPEFVVFGGDLAYSFGKKREPERPLRWLTFFGGITKYLRKGDELIPIIGVIGNHEVQGSFGQTPQQATLYYTFFPSNGYRKINFDSYLSLFLLDSGHTHEISGEQREWLKSALQQNKDIPYRFAVYHVPAYPTVRPYTYRPSREIRKNWVPLFEENHLMAAFKHHDHTLKRTFPLLGREISQKDGVVYFGDGSCGVGDPRGPKKPGTVWYLAHSKQAQAVWEVVLTKEKASFEALSPKGDILDKAEIYSPAVSSPAPG